MTLDAEDITAIASEVVRQMRQADNLRMDAEYLASLPIEDFKRIQQEKMRQAKAAMKKGVPK